MEGEAAETALGLAAQRGDLAVVRQLLASAFSPAAGSALAADINASSRSSTASSAGGDDPGNSALHWAAYFDEEAVVAALLEHPALQVHTANRRGNTAVHVAAAGNSLRILRRLAGAVAAGQAGQADNNPGPGPGYAGLARVVDTRNHWQETPLHLAAAAGHAAAAEELLRAGAQSGLRDQWGRTPLQVARQCGERELAAVLAAALPPTSDQSDPAADEAATTRATVGAGPLQDAGVCREFLARVQALHLSHHRGPASGAEAPPPGHARTSCPPPPPPPPPSASHAQPAAAAAPPSASRLAAELAEKTAKRQQQEEEEDEEKEKQGEKEKEKEKEKEAAAHSAVSPTGSTAAPGRRVPALAQCVEYPGDVAEITRLLALQPGEAGYCDPAGCDYYGYAALHKFAAWNKLDLLQLLVPALAPAALSAPGGPDGGTALHCAVDAGAHAAVSFLCTLPAGPDRHARDRKGRTARDLAEELGDDTAVRLLALEDG